MTDKIVIQSSRYRVASRHLLWVCLGLIWPLLYIFAIHPADHINWFFKGLFALCAVASGAVAFAEALKAWRVLTTPGHWKAVIGANRLVWDVAIPSEHLPLDIALVKIAKASRLETRRTVKDSDGDYCETSETFELHLSDGRVLSIGQELAGLNPHRVFLALSEHGIRYEDWEQDCTVGSLDMSKVFRRIY